MRSRVFLSVLALMLITGGAALAQSQAQPSVESSETLTEAERQQRCAETPECVEARDAMREAAQEAAQEAAEESRSARDRGIPPIDRLPRCPNPADPRCPTGDPQNITRPRANPQPE
jgi:hypothetical protein